MTGWVKIAGLGPGAEALVTPEVQSALAEATDVVGYIPYVARVPKRPCLTLHASDNRVELERAQDALNMALAGKKVVVVSSGDPGVFAMAAAVLKPWKAAPWNGALLRSKCFPVSRQCLPPQPVSEHRWDMISVRSISATTSNLGR